MSTLKADLAAARKRERARFLRWRRKPGLRHLTDEEIATSIPVQDGLNKKAWPPTVPYRIAGVGA